MSRPNIHQQVTFLTTDDLERSEHFYGEVLGLEMVLDQGVCKIYGVSRDAFLGVCVSKQESGPHEDVVITLVSNQVDAWHKYLVDKDVLIEKAPNHNEKFNIYHLFLRDPNGYLLEIQEFLAPEWPAEK